MELFKAFFFSFKFLSYSQLNGTRYSNIVWLICICSESEGSWRNPFKLWFYRDDELLQRVMLAEKDEFDYPIHKLHLDWEFLSLAQDIWLQMKMHVVHLQKRPLKRLYLSPRYPKEILDPLYCSQNSSLRSLSFLHSLQALFSQQLLELNKHRTSQIWWTGRNVP